MTVKAIIKDYQRNRPRFFMVAAEHRFSCDCMDCVAFLFPSLDPSDMTPDDAKLYELVANANEITPEAITTLRKLFNEYL